MQKQFMVSFLRDLPNETFVYTHEQIISVCDSAEHQISSSSYEKALEKVIINSAQVNKIKAKDRVHELTEPITKLHSKKISAFTSIRYFIKANLTHLEDENKDEATYFEKWFRKHSDIKSNPTQDVMTNRIDDIADDMEQDARLLEAITKMGALSLFTNLVNINNEYKTLRHLRAVDRAEKKNRYVDNLSVRNTAMADLLILFREIEREAHWNENKGISHLVKSLKDVLSRAKAIHKQQKTQRKNQRDKDMEDINTEQSGVAPIVISSQEDEKEEPKYG